MKRLFLIAPWMADFGHGLIIGTLFHLALGIPPSFVLYAFAILFSVIPDLDGIAEFLKFKNIGASKERPRDHREGLHYPLLWLLTGAGIFLISPLFGSLFIACTMAHFLNDSWGTGWGIKWLWPLSQNSYKFFSSPHEDAHVDVGNIVSSLDPIQKAEAIETKGNPQWLEDIYLKPTAISIIEYSTFIFGLTLLFLFLMVS